MNGLPVAPISGGLDDSRAPGSQAAGTYYDGLNVRGFDARTQRQVWGAQRAGTTTIRTPLPNGDYARHFAVASKLVSERRQRVLSLTPVEGADPPTIEVDWSSRLGDRVLDVDVGVDDQGYYLLASGDVAVVNRRGVETGRIRSSVPQGFRAVPRVFSALDRAVYTAATRDDPIEGIAGFVFRWVRQEDKTYSLAWSAPFPTRIATFVVGPNVLYVAEDGVPDDDGELPDAALSQIGAPSLGPEVAWRETVFPRPCYDLTVNPDGQVFASCPSNVDRDGDSTLFTARNVGWTPFELPAFEIGNVWSWIDAAAVNEEDSPANEGDAVVRMRDRRFDPSPLATLDQDIPRRELGRSPSSLFSPPTFSEDAFGGAGGVKFSGGTALISEPTSSLSVAAEQRALLPGVLPSWTLVCLVEFTEEQGLASGIRRVLSQRTANTAQPDWILFALGQAVTLLDARLTGSTSTSAGTTTALARTALLSFQFRGSGNAVDFRVNGTPVTPSAAFGTLDQGGEYTLQSTSVPFPGPFTVIGGGRPSSVNLIDPVTARVSSSAITSAGDLRQVIDGNTSSGGTALGDGFFAPNTIVVDLGTSVAFDSVSLWVESVSNALPDIRVRIGNDPDPENVFSLELIIPFGAVGSKRIQLSTEDPTGNAYQYIQISVAQGTGLIQLREFQVHSMDILDAGDSADFNLAELIAFRNTGTTELVFTEGYMAHRWGISHTLDPAHQFFGPGNFPVGIGTTVADQDAAVLRGRLSTPFPILAKYGTDGTPLAVYAGAGVGAGAAYSDGKVFTIGEPDAGAPSTIPDAGSIMARFRDEPRDIIREASLLESPGFTVEREPVALEAGPCSSIFAATKDGTRLVDGLSMLESWHMPSSNVNRPHRAVPAGLQLDATLQGGDCGPEYLYVAQGGIEGASRITTLGLAVTGRPKGRDIELLVVTLAGDVLRGIGDDWETVEAGALLGMRPASATLFGRTVFADGIRYRVYDHQLRQLRDFEAAVSGTFPPRCDLIAAYRGRLVLAGGDNAFTVYQSAYGDIFDFDVGPEIQTIAQAIAGTVASQGLTPEPITALMPWRDDLLYIGTTESLFVLTGDLADGGRMDHVDKSQGVAPGYAWCESPRGLYYFSGRGGVMLITAQGPVMVSQGRIQRRLEELDLKANRVELTYNWIDKTVHVFLIPHALRGGVKHFVLEELTGAWHPDGFGPAFETAITAAASLVGDTAEDRSLILGFAGGSVERWDQYAPDDSGRPVESFAVIGPLLPEASGIEAHVGGIYGQLASDQAGISVAVKGSNSPDAPGPSGPSQELLPGRGLGVGMNVTAPSLFIEVRGLGRAWSVHQLRAEIAQRGSTRRTNG